MGKLKIIPKKNVEQLPKTAGVYLFYENKPKSNTQHLTPIYIGKAINIKDRVKNHFYPIKYREAIISPSAKLFNRVNQPSYRDNLFINKITKIGFIETGSEIEALILEAQLIKKYQPKFNVVWRDDKNYFYVAIAQNKNKIPYFYITHQPYQIKNQKSNIKNSLKIRNLKLEIQYLGPFVDGNALKKTLKFLRRVFPFYTSSRHPKNKCAWCHLELCPGPNPDIAKYKKKINKLILILQSKRKNVLNSLKKEMAELSKQRKFEEALKIRDKIYALQHVMAHSKVIGNQRVENNSWPKTEKILRGILAIKNPILRIECYDVSNIQGKNATGSMVVFINEKPDKSQYRKFKISPPAGGENKPNDIAMLKEVLERRFAHSEWSYPEVMLLDGGRAQLNMGIKTKNQREKIKDTNQKLKTANIKIISIAKGRQNLFIENKKQPIPLKSLPQEVYNLIKYLDDEAHRFAIAYHKKLRKRALGITNNY